MEERARPCQKVDADLTPTVDSERRVSMFFLFLLFFVVPSEAFFFALERPSGPFWVQFGVILKSNSSLFLSKSFFEKHAFRVDETILFKVREGSISVLFCNISGFPRQAGIFLRF